MTGKVHNALILFALPFLTGLLLGISALPSKLWFLSFVAFIPLLIAAEMAISAKRPLFVFVLQIMLSLVVFYGIVYYWVLQTAHWGFLIGFLIIVPHLLILSPYILFRKSGSRFAPLYFIAAWLTVELVQSYFQLGSPFFNLGNNPGACPKIIQWYSLTGAAGGTLWILTLNFLLLSLGKTIRHQRNIWLKKSLAVSGILLLPMALSLILFYSYHEKGKSAEVLIVHPSTDNTGVKYRVNIYDLMNIYLGILLPHLTERTEYVVLPETALTNAGWVSDYDCNLLFEHWFRHTGGYPDLKLVTGAITYEAIADVNKIRSYEKIPGIRYSEKKKTWYKTYNAALLLEQGQPAQIRVKEGLVPYSEFAPYPRILPRLAPVGIDFQFSKRDDNPSVFKDGDQHKTAAIICYELVYGRLFYRAARKGAEAFFIMLNEGWYNEPRVSRQFLQLSVVRAIENRRCVAHSSNLGISAFISQRGEVTASEAGRFPAVLKQDIHLNQKITLASTVGNFIELAAALVTFLLLTGKIMKKL